MTIDYQHYFQSYLDGIKQEGRYRYFANLERIAGDFPNAYYTAPNGDRKKVKIWCSNDYLGMGQHPKVTAAAIDAIKRSGSGAGGTRNISGTTAYHAILEDAIADLHHKEAGLVFSSGYVANESTLSALGKLMPDCAIFSDALNHASMIRGVANSHCEKFIFRHNDIEHLETLLQSVNASRPKIIAFESVYSMEGDIGHIESIVNLAAKYNALTYIDEVHAVGLYGARGGGVAEQHNLMKQIDIIEGTFGKAYGSMGGFITGKRNIIDAVRSIAAGFIFTTSLPPATLAAAHAAVEHLKTSSLERETMHANVSYLKSLLRQAELTFYDGNTHIVPLIVGRPNCCRAITDTLLHTHNIYVQPINYPTVPKGTERLRLTASAVHTKEDIESLVQILKELWQENHLFEHNYCVASS